MKEYKYKINGNVYKVAIGDIEDNIAHVEVNGTPYKVEMEKAPKAVVKPVVRPVSTSPAPAPATVVKPHLLCHTLQRKTIFPKLFYIHFTSRLLISFSTA